MLILKLTNHKRQSHGGFQWPDCGPVECDDWDPAPRCGGGLHGWARGEGAYQHDFNDGQWLVVNVADALVVSVDGGDKVKFPKGEVVYCGTREGAVAILTASGSLSSGSDPAWACLTPNQCREVAFRAADRAIHVYAPHRLRARGHEADALTLEALPKIVDIATALQAKDAASYATSCSAAYASHAAAASAASAADAAAYAAAAAADASYASYATSYSAAYASCSAASASADASADDASYASYASYAASSASYAASAAAARKAETELCRRDKLDVLGVK